MTTIWNNQRLFEHELDKVKNVHLDNPIEFTADMRQSDIMDHLKYLRSKTYNGLMDVFRLLRITLGLEEKT